MFFGKRYGRARARADLIASETVTSDVACPTEPTMSSLPLPRASAPTAAAATRALRLLLLTALAAAPALASQDASNCTAPPPSPDFDVATMNGEWFEIARIQTAGGNALQQFCACTNLDFSTDAANGTAGAKDVLNSCRFLEPNGAWINATSYLYDKGQGAHWLEAYFPGGPASSYNFILAGNDTRGVPWAVEYDCSNNALFGDNYCVHVLSRQPTGFPDALLQSILQEVQVTMKLNPQNRPVNITLQEGCW